MKEELAKILDEFIGGELAVYPKPETPDQAKANYKLNIKVQELKNQAITSIINLVDKKVIGEDDKHLSSSARLHNQMLAGDYQRLGANKLRAKQRAKLKGVSNEHTGNTRSS